MELRTLRCFVVVQPAQQAEYVLVWNKGQCPSGLIQEFIQYIQDCGYPLELVE